MGRLRISWAFCARGSILKRLMGGFGLEGRGWGCAVGIKGIGVMEKSIGLGYWVES